MGLAACVPRPCYRPAQQPEWLRGDSFSGKFFFADGSGKHPSWPEARLCSWAVVELHSGVQYPLLRDPGLDAARAVWCGALRRPVQTVAAAEHTAVIEAVKHTTPPICVFSDCATVVNTWNDKGRWGKAKRGPLGDLWRQLIALTGMPPWRGRLHVRKSIAHVTLAAAHASSMRASEWCGNHVADLAAKHALLHWGPAGAAADEWVARATEVRHVAVHLGLAQAPALSAPRAPRGARQPAPLGPRRAARRRPARQHTAIPTLRGIRCMVCARTASAAAVGKFRQA